MKFESNKKVKFIWQFLKPYFRAVISGIICTSMKSLCLLMMPIILATIIDEVFYHKNALFLKNSVTIYLILFIGYIIIWLISSYNWFHLLNKFVVSIRVELFKKIVKTKYSESENINTGDFEAILSSDATKFLDEVQNNYIDITNNLISYIIAISIIFKINFWIALVIIPFAPISILVNKYVGKILKEYGKIRRNKYGKYVNIITEYILGMRELRQLNLYTKTKQRIFHNTSNVIRNDVKISKINFISKKINELLNLVLDIILYVFVASFVFKDQLTVGNFTAVLAYIQTSKLSLLWLSDNYMSTQERKASIQKVIDIFDLKDEKEQNLKPPIEIKYGELIFKNVYFNYHNCSYVLKNANFHTQPKDKIALIGSNGIGKTTITKLILGLYEPQSGTISIDGKNINEFSYSSLREFVGLVQQDINLFDGSIKYNLTFGNKKYNEELIWKACAEAQIDSYIKNLPSGLNTNVNSLGHSLSYGEKQRIMIARLIIKNPKIIILDEATSSLDTENESEILSNLFRIFKEKTMIVISHHVPVLKYCNKIIIMDKKNLNIFNNGSKDLCENEYYTNFMKFVAQ